MYPGITSTQIKADGACLSISGMKYDYDNGWTNINPTITEFHLRLYNLATTDFQVTVYFDDWKKVNSIRVGFLFALNTIPFEFYSNYVEINHNLPGTTTV